jgi:hypothetical protein
VAGEILRQGARRRRRILLWVSLFLAGLVLGLALPWISTEIRGRHYLSLMADPEWGIYGCERMAELGRRAQPFLLKGLQSKNASVRAHCVACYEGYGPDPFADRVKVLVDCLYDPDGWVVDRALDAFDSWVLDEWQGIPAYPPGVALDLILKREFADPEAEALLAPPPGPKRYLVVESTNWLSSRHRSGPRRALLALGKAYSGPDLESTWSSPRVFLACRCWALECLIHWHYYSGFRPERIPLSFREKIGDADPATRKLARIGLVLTGQTSTDDTAETSSRAP